MGNIMGNKKLIPQHFETMSNIVSFLKVRGLE